MNKNFGFTLAEVLITLGIIGVVAAMTIPTLVSRYQKQVLVNQLKKSISSIENNNRKLLADGGVDSLEYVLAELEEKIEELNFDESLDDGSRDKKVLSMYYDFFETHFLWKPVGKNTDFYKIFFGEDDGGLGFYSADGACFYPYQFSQYSTQVFFIDINCDKSPNKAGRDRFMVAFDENSGLFMNTLTKDKASEYCNLALANEDTSSWLQSVGCSQLIRYDGWKMNY